MQRYLDSLFVHLINIGKYDILLEGPPSCKELSIRLKEDIDVYLGTISIENLTAIMDSFEPGSIQETWADIGKHTNFRNNLDYLLKELVSLLLTYAILTRLKNGAVNKEPASLPREASQSANT
ncbi:MAG: hypothetical protein AAB628_02190 [Patescibacteria group bacterium]